MLFWIYWLGMLIFPTILGFLPLVIVNSKRIVNMLSLYGAGMLIGAAFIIVMPEASVTLFESFSSPIQQDGGKSIDNYL